MTNAFWGLTAFFVCLAVLALIVDHPIFAVGFLLVNFFLEEIK